MLATIEDEKGGRPVRQDDPQMRHRIAVEGQGDAYRLRNDEAYVLVGRRRQVAPPDVSRGCASCRLQREFPRQAGLPHSSETLDRD
jgi:hypothetical protein